MDFRTILFKHHCFRRSIRSCIQTNNRQFFSISDYRIDKVNVFGNPLSPECDFRLKRPTPTEQWNRAMLATEMSEDAFHNQDFFYSAGVHCGSAYQGVSFAIDLMTLPFVVLHDAECLIDDSRHLVKRERQFKEIREDFPGFAQNVYQHTVGDFRTRLDIINKDFAAGGSFSAGFGVGKLTVDIGSTVLGASAVTTLGRKGLYYSMKTATSMAKSEILKKLTVGNLREAGHVLYDRSIPILRHWDSLKYDLKAEQGWRYIRISEPGRKLPVRVTADQIAKIRLWEKSYNDFMKKYHNIESDVAEFNGATRNLLDIRATNKVKDQLDPETLAARLKELDGHKIYKNGKLTDHFDKMLKPLNASKKLIGHLNMQMRKLDLKGEIPCPVSHIPKP